MMKTLEKGKIGSMEVKNRVFFAPMGYGLDGYGPHAMRYFEERCRGGAAMIFTPYYVLAGGEAAGSTPKEAREGMKKMAEMAHSYGVRACMQIIPGLGRVNRFVLSSILADAPVPSYCSSAVPEFYYEDRICEALSIEDIHDQMERMREIGKFLGSESGYDCLEIHAYGGYLTDCFLTARWNLRTDEYGGPDIRSRSKYLLDMYHALREGAGADFPIFVKFTPCHYMEGEGYRTMEEGLELAKILEEAGVDLLHVDAGCYENWELCMPPSYQQEQTYALTSAEAVKRAVQIPVAAAGKLGIPERGEEALRDGKCDFLIVGREFLADPQYVNKLRSGTLDDIRPCIGCDEGCIARVAIKGGSISCAVNADTGFEIYRHVPKADPPKKILVIGAGIGGMSFAYDAKLAGHDVEIWEQRPCPGGLLTAAGRPAFKKEVNDLLAWYRLQLSKLGVKIRYNTPAAAKDILAFGADDVILATGCDSAVPKSIPGIESRNVVTAVDALNNVATLGHHLIIVGSGLVGCETAVHLAGFGHQIDIIEMAPEIMPKDVFLQCRNMLSKMIAWNDHISVHTSTKLLRVGPDGIVAEKDGQAVKMPCDTVVMALGLTEHKTGLEEQLRGKVRVHSLGARGRVLDATSAAREALLDVSGMPESQYTRPEGMA